MRIVSLLPSATEMVAVLGLGEHLVAVTHECDFPDFVRTLPKVTRTRIPHGAPSAEIDRLVRAERGARPSLYDLDEEAFAAARPDLVITQALCDVCAVAEAEVRAAACRLPGQPRVINLEPTTLAEVFAAIRQVADACGVPERGRAAVASLEARVAAIEARAAGRAPASVVLLEWLHPPFSCGHWTPELVRRAGGRELLGREGERSRTLAWEEIAAADPDVIAVACCGFDEARARADMALLEQRAEWSTLRAVRAGRVAVFDGNQFFSRPGPRLVESLELLEAALARWA